jgi:hypothetical protein
MGLGASHSRLALNLTLLTIFSVEPWGRISTPRKDIAASSKSVVEGGTGVAEQFWTWCEEQVKAYH